MTGPKPLIDLQCPQEDAPKAYFKNEDEYHIGMRQHVTVKGRALKKHVQLSKDQHLLLESQDAQYVGMRERADKKAVEKRIASLHFLNSGRPNKHMIFVDDDDIPTGSAAATGLC